MTQANEREYVIPLRKEWMKKPRYKRTRASVIGIKKFIAKHMKVPDRNLDKVKLDVYLNNEIWFRGSKKPPAKIKVIAKRVDDKIIVEHAELPDKWTFAKARHEKRHKKAETKKKIERAETRSEERTEEKTEEEKKDESEKAKAVADVREKQAEQQAKAQKQIEKAMKAPKSQPRKALKK
ncbi:hypothetical protein COU62_01730 [Candidatus Pacearchaeota archaeon CG10_big_fil_rev_8_21_14_0_10_35_219]|nr:hypothetical protein [Candidatus Pacearchaeota archaeon]OIO43152.1 MAG: hypothetical protein AUJ63_01005 [Candidatus Pacearchaeota archaeon CG1_02_35_32]PIO08081.1 MAG: hypothetical protein COU62_01730 [Candidatus Pacearchaeota archaeon CG10_big_fil_rev_8_21_14_0_10_35_219]PIY81595.1 MAG: hypothetical protein COY79_02565 [Candidatus Pacearchaeota archaeon CG_4_10_14_0_8_um_filter_35_169]PIZ78970.1 MAG: hypothetical protein COY00_04950 [Candidatus Pacearchaeota archaeon CG_4_10_14_0_2_um_filt